MRQTMRWEFTDEGERASVLGAYEKAFLEAVNSGRECDIVIEVRSRDGNASVEPPGIRYLPVVEQSVQEFNVDLPAIAYRQKKPQQKRRTRR